MNFRKKFLFLCLVGYTISLLPMDAPDQGPSDVKKNTRQEKGKEKCDAIDIETNYSPEDLQSFFSSERTIPQQSDDIIQPALKYHPAIDGEQISEQNHSFQFTASIQEMDPYLVDLALQQAPEELHKIISAFRYPTLIKNYKFQNLLLLVGPPGTGKSTLIRALAYHLNTPCTLLHGSLLANEYKNSGQQNLMRVIKPLLESPKAHIIGIEELNAITDSHKDKRNADKDMAMALWSMLDEVAQRRDILFIGTTNDMSKLPDQLKSRFGNGIIRVEYCDDAQREAIAKYYLPNKKSHEFLPFIISQTRYRSTRDLEKLIMEAITNARFRQLRTLKVTPEDFVSDGDTLNDILERIKDCLQERQFYTFHRPEADQRRAIICQLLPPKHICSDEFIEELVSLTKNQADSVIRELVYLAVLGAFNRETHNLELTLDDFKNTIAKKWYAWYHPYSVGKKVKPYIKPFFKDAYPLILNTAGLLLQFTGLGMNYYYSERNDARASTGLGYQATGLLLQKASTIIAYKEALARHWQFNMDTDYIDRYKVDNQEIPPDYRGQRPTRNATLQELAAMANESIN